MKTFSIKEAIRTAWALWKSHWKIISLSTATMIGLNSVDFDHYGVIESLVVFVVSIVSIIVTIGWTKILLKIYDKESTRLNDLFDHFRLFWKYLGLCILLGLIVLIGLILLVVPGIYFLLKYQFAVLILIDKEKIAIKDAMKESAKLTEGIKWKLLGLVIVMGLINIAGLLIFVVGAIISIPVPFLAYIHVYRNLSASTPATPAPILIAEPAPIS